MLWDEGKGAPGASWGEKKWMKCSETFKSERWMGCPNEISVNDGDVGNSKTKLIWCSSSCFHVTFMRESLILRNMQTALVADYWNLMRDLFYTSTVLNPNRNPAEEWAWNPCRRSWTYKYQLNLRFLWYSAILLAGVMEWGMPMHAWLTCCMNVGTYSSKKVNCMTNATSIC
jgi:hypothetical protein